MQTQPGSGYNKARPTEAGLDLQYNTYNRCIKCITTANWSYFIFLGHCVEKSVCTVKTKKFLSSIGVHLHGNIASDELTENENAAVFFYKCVAGTLCSSVGLN